MQTLDYILAAAIYHRLAFDFAVGERRRGGARRPTINGSPL